MKIFRVSADKNQIFSEKKRVFFSLSSRWKEDKEEGGTFLGEVGDDADGSGDSLDALVLLVVLAGRHSPAKNSAIAKPEANAEATQRRRGSGAAESSTYSQKSEAEGGKRKCVAEREKGRGNRLEKEAKRYCRSHLVGPAVAFIVIR